MDYRVEDVNYRFLETNLTIPTDRKLPRHIIPVIISLGRENEDIDLCRDREDHYLTLGFANSPRAVSLARFVRQTRCLTVNDILLRRLRDVQWPSPGTLQPSEYRGTIPEKTLVAVLRNHYHLATKVQFRTL